MCTHTHTYRELGSCSKITYTVVVRGPSWLEQILLRLAEEQFTPIHLQISKTHWRVDWGVCVMTVAGFISYGVWSTVAFLRLPWEKPLLTEDSKTGTDVFILFISFLQPNCTVHWDIVLPPYSACTSFIRFMLLDTNAYICIWHSEPWLSSDRAFLSTRDEP